MAQASRKYTRFGPYVRAALAVADIVLVNIVFGITLLLYPTISEQVGHDIRVLWLLVNLSYVPVALWFSGSKHSLRAITMDRVMLDALRAIGIHGLFFLAMLAFVRIAEIPIMAYVQFYGTLAIVLMLWYIISRRAIKTYRRHGHNFTRCVIVGTGETARRLGAELNVDSGFGYKLLGYFGAERPDDELKDAYLGTLDNLEDFVVANHVENIFFAQPGIDETLTRVMKIADDNVAELFYVPQLSRFINRSFVLQNIGPLPLLTPRNNPLRNSLNRGIKRGFDLLFSTLVLILFYPLVYIPVAIAIKVSSPGPIYFKQERTGYRGRTFKCYKFRTMRVNNDSDKAQATRHDPRKTRIGDFLRRTSIDELPQFINVWRGEMSVVGPRPHMLIHTQEYSKLVDMYMVRHTVKPGITGWAQVNGYRGLTDELWKMQKRVEYDVWYIENWSFFLDLKIIVRTIINAFKGENNAF